ncbi:type II secretion system protein [Francisella hispaniensis]|uniref:type II secretion system protein n=1 Tax=Francisella hispaniensis TaxID=622488 RepID=UPI001E3B8479|nr:type II secretion system protein [Francisella hispaniensis]
MRDKAIKGFTIIEVLIVAALGLFTLMTAFYAIGNILSNAILTEKKVELVDELETRVDEYMLTGNFDNSSLGDISFSEASSGSIREFTATNNKFSLEAVKRAYASVDPLTELINQQLGPYMQRANEIYVNANATVIDDPAVLSDIEVARNTLLSPSTAKWSSNTGVLLNLGNTQIVTAVPLDDPPLGSGAYITVAPFTNADITPAIRWQCTAFGFNSELLPSWCVL